jgi:hypothetical protein
VFQAYQDLFEQVASDAFDADAINEAAVSSSPGEHSTE